MKKTAFSLIELILVIILIGLTYSLVLGKINKKKNIQVKKLENLKTILKNEQNVELIVYDNCSKILLKNSSKKFDGNIFKNIEVYSVENEDLKKIDFPPISIKDEIYDVCLRFKIFANRSSSSYIIKQDNRYIVFFPYFRDTQVFYSKDEAIKAFTNYDLKQIYENEI